MPRGPAVITALVLIVCNACSNGDASPTETSPKLQVVVTPKSDTIPIGGSIQIKSNSFYCHAVDFGSDVTIWSSSNPGVASIFGNGLVTGVSKGSALIVATRDCYGQGVAADTNVTYVDTLHVNSAKANPGSAAVQMTASVAGRPSSSGDYVFTTNNRSIATVTSGGMATAVSPGFALISISQTVNGATSKLATGEFYVTGPGTCTPAPTGRVTRSSLRFGVQSDPGNHAAQIGLPATMPFAEFDFTGSFNSQISVSAVQPFVSVTGGWMGTGNCAFVANGTGTIGGQPNVGVRLEGTWTSGALNLKYTVGTNGELSGGATVYTVTG